MARIYLQRNTFLLELTEKYDGLDEEEISLIANCVDEDIVFNGHIFKWISAISGFYDTEEDNIGKCANCGAWTTDCEGRNPVKDLSIGAKIEGVLLCDLCLPKDHPLAF